MRPDSARPIVVAWIAAAAALWAAAPAVAATAGEASTAPLPAEAPAAGGGSEPPPDTREHDPGRGEGPAAPADGDATPGVGERGVARAGTEDPVRAAGRRRKLGERTLREGMSGSDVRHLQKILTAMNFETRVDGRYGRETRRSVRRYDRWKEPRVNGVVHMPQAKRMKRRYRSGSRYRKHVFPVRGPHDYGGAGSRFGSPRSGHRHQGQDVAAAEGTRLVSVHEGRVATRAFQASGAGYYVVIHGKDGSDSVYMHLKRPARVRPGDRVMAGQTIGRVGTTGSSTGPHLHFELWTRHWYAGGDPYDPLAKLKRWDRRT